MILYGLCIFLGIITFVATLVNEETTAIIMTVTGLALLATLVLISRYANKRNGKQKIELLDQPGMAKDYVEPKRVAR